MRNLKSGKELEELVKKEKSLVVDFYTTWCGLCKMLEPLLEQYEKEHPGVVIVRIDCDKFEELSDKFGVQSVPTVVAFKKREIVAQWSGFVNYQTLCRRLRQVG